MILSKQFLRKKLLEKRKELTSEQVKNLSKSIQRILETLKIYRNAKNLMVYVNFENEPQTIGIIKKNLRYKREVFVPRMKNNRIEAVKILNLKHLRKTIWRIKEPGPSFRASTCRKFDIIIIPGIAFDVKGNRIGFGAGFYDRFLKKNKGIRVALAYDFQVKKSIPSKKYDEKVDLIITEKHIYERRDK